MDLLSENVLQPKREQVEDQHDRGQSLLNNSPLSIYSEEVLTNFVFQRFFGNKELQN